jgi:hypothetical protein
MYHTEQLMDRIHHTMLEGGGNGGMEGWRKMGGEIEGMDG